MLESAPANGFWSNGCTTEDSASGAAGFSEPSMCCSMDTEVRVASAAVPASRLRRERNFNGR